MWIALGKRLRSTNLLRNRGKRPRDRGTSAADAGTNPDAVTVGDATSGSMPEAGIADAGELWRLRASVPDTPGRLARVAAGLAAYGGNIRTVNVHPTPEGAVDEIVLHAPRGVAAEDLVRAVGEAGGRDVRAARTDVRELEDLPTRAFVLAAQLVDGSVELVAALRRTLGEVEIAWQEGEADEVEELTERGMVLPAPGGGAFRVERRGAAFTPAEFARGRALTTMAAACRDVSRGEAEVVVVAGRRFRLRRADRRDADLVLQFQQRCSTASRHERYFGPAPTADHRTLLRRLLTPALGRTWVVERDVGEIVAMGNLMYAGNAGELALLVRDDWQGWGIGSMLAGRLLAEAETVALTSVVAHTRVHNRAIARTLRSAGLELAGVPEPGEWRWSRTLRAATDRNPRSTVDTVG